jgi:acyl-CoA thioesterase
VTEPDAQQRAERVVALMTRTDAYSQWLAVEIVDIAPARVVIRMTVRPEMCNGFGVCHGGVSFAFADSAFAFACNTQGNLAVSIDNSMSYPAPIHPGEIITATATEASRSNRILYYHVHVTKADGTVVGLFRGTAYRTEKPHQI